MNVDSATSRPIRIFADRSLHDAVHIAAGSGSAKDIIWIKAAAFFNLIDIEAVGDFAVSDSTSGQNGSSSGEIDEKRAGKDLQAMMGKTHCALEYKFLADSMVAQVGRWLRTIGVDVVIWTPADVPAAYAHDPKSLMLAKAAEEDRIVLTRDTQLPSRRDAGACFVLGDDLCYKQFREVKAQFGLHWRKQDRASRCARCNSTRFSTVDADYARSQTKEVIQRKVLETVSKFWTCDQCSKIYWEGPKYTPTSAPASSDSSGCGVMYQPVARRPVHLIRIVSPATT